MVEELKEVTECGDLSDVAPAAASSGIRTTAIIRADGLLHEAPSQGWFLVAERPDGYCLIDSPLKPDWQHGGWFEADFKTRWDDSRTPARLYLEAHQILHEELDEAEHEDFERQWAAGTSTIDPAKADYAGEQCMRFSYDVSEGKFTRLTAEYTEGACEPAPKPRHHKSTKAKGASQ
jgi:hypothetical protein